MRTPLSEAASQRSDGQQLSPGARCRPELAADPVAAVVEAHEQGRLLELRTSGTAGLPRSVVRSTGSWWRSFDAYAALTGVQDGARLWVPGPLAATMNLFAAVHARVAGARLVDDPAVATHACLTPAQLDRSGDRLAPGTGVVVAGDRLSAPLARRARERGLVPCHYYGAAELSFVAAGPDADHLTAFPGVEVEVRDGVVWARSPFLCDEAEGGPLRRDEAGWATVGDRGRLEGDRVVVLGRPDAVVTAGATVPLAEVEGVLRRHARGDLLLVGVPHPSLGAVLTAVVTDPADRALADRARTDLPEAWRPRRWVVWAELPLTPAGKPDRSAVVARLQAGQGGGRGA